MTWTVIDTLLMSAGGNWWIFVLQAVLIVGVIWVLLHKTYFQNERNELTDDDVNARIQAWLAKWEPEELVPSKVVKESILNPRVLYGKAEKHIIVDDQVCLNLSTMNFLNLIGSEIIEDRAVEAIEKYGVGSCGPRGFYGTVEAHLDLEERLAKFMDTEDAIVYSYGFSCIASAIPAYAKRNDIIFADERVNFAIQKGLFASRSTVKYFGHNDHRHLEALLMEQEREDKLNPVKAAKTRRFVIIEGIYMNTGELVELPYYMVLKEQYKFRLFIDESISFGTICGGHGVTKYYNIPIKQVDMIMGSLEYAVGSIGGFCCGSKFIIEHQRLSGLGYCFSASQPPLHAVAALKAIDLMQDNPLIFAELTTACKAMSVSLRKLRGMRVKGWDESPVKHLYLTSSHAPQEETLQKISDFCFRHGLAITCPSYIEKEEKYDPIPSLRICVNRSLEQSEIEEVANVLQTALDEMGLSNQTEDDEHELSHQTEDDDCEAHQPRQQQQEEVAEDLQAREARILEEDRLNLLYQERVRRTHHQIGYSQPQTREYRRRQQEAENLQALEARIVEEEEEARLSMLYQEQVRRAHHQIGYSQPQTREDKNRQRKQLTDTAHVKEMDESRRKTQEEHQRNVQAFQHTEAHQDMYWTPEEARESDMEEEDFHHQESQGEHGDTREIDQREDNRQIRRRTRHE